MVRALKQYYYYFIFCLDFAVWFLVIVGFYFSWCSLFFLKENLSHRWHCPWILLLAFCPTPSVDLLVGLGEHISSWHIWTHSLRLMFCLRPCSSPKFSLRVLRTCGPCARWLRLFLCTSSQNSFPLSTRHGNFKREWCILCFWATSLNVIVLESANIGWFWREGLIAFQTELRFPNVSFSVCNYLKPYLNPIKEHTILIVICTNEVFAIVIASMCVLASIDTSLEKAVVTSRLVQFSQSVGWVSTFCLVPL